MDNVMKTTRDMSSRAMNSRLLLVGICAWISVCLLVAGWMPELSGNLQTIWLVSGMLGLISAVRLAEVIKADVRIQEDLINEYMHAAMTDGLTGLANRHALDRMLISLLRDQQGSCRSVSMIMIDIDHFKAFNDQYGHQAGDAVLRTVSQKMHEFFGGKGFVARYGGEEFGVILPNCRLHEADRLAEACRLTIKEIRCEFRERRFSVTISCGVTEARIDDTPGSLTQRADMALYAAKKMGRDMIWVVDPDATASPESIRLPANDTSTSPSIEDCMQELSRIDNPTAC